VADHEGDYDNSDFDPLVNKFAFNQWISNDNEFVDDVENLDDFLDSVKADIDDPNISGLFKVDIIDE